MATRADETTNVWGRRSRKKDCGRSGVQAEESAEGSRCELLSNKLSFHWFYSQDYRQFFDQHKLNDGYPTYKVKYYLICTQKTLRSANFSLCRPRQELNSSKHNFQTLNVTEAITQIVNNCINVILDCLFVPGTSFPRVLPKHAHLQFHSTRWLRRSSGRNSPSQIERALITGKKKMFSYSSCGIFVCGIGFLLLKIVNKKF